MRRGSPRSGANGFAYSGNPVAFVVCRPLILVHWAASFKVVAISQNRPSPMLSLLGDIAAPRDDSKVNSRRPGRVEWPSSIALRTLDEVNMNT